MDKKAKQILIRTFWQTGGWKPGPPVLAGEDFEYARSQGVMFDPVTITHDELIERLHELHQRITREQVSEAFLHSLSTRKIHLRSALSSWALTAELPLHTYEQRRAVHANTSSCGDCNFCGLMTDDNYTNADLNVLQFERIKWGGVRLNWLLYCWLDLELFSREQPVTAGAEDVEIFRQLLAQVQDCVPNEGARQLEKRWKDWLPSSKNERDQLMEICGYAGILVPRDTLRLGRGHYSDFVSVAGWEGQDRYDADAVADYFGQWGLQ
ncbi:hypothetical protein [Paenibacillus wulumuqiensis]|uniref:hypothetical protein n=1 Tax=Paenibacillus wulumuqiensis TaxID=1567107 RepID=UPI000619BD15|nr:hypothetical protein [Paenibacillus wulumuqiensis]